VSKPFRELQLLADYTGGILAAGNWVRPAPNTIGGELDSNERAEIVMLEIIPPINVLGAPEDVRIQLRLDGEVDEKMYFYGHRDLLTFAPKLSMKNEVVHALGKPLYNVGTGLQGAVDGRCPKYNRTLSFDCYTAGGITVAASWRVKAWGIRYAADSFGTVFGGLQIGGTDVLTDKATRRNVTINKPMVAVTPDTWDQLPGGLKQAVPKISNYIRVAANANATTPNLPYEFRFKDVVNVATEEEDLRWEYALSGQILYLKGLGIRTTPASNLAQLFVDVGGDERPKNRWTTTEFNNPRIFGHLGAYMGLAEHRAIPLLDDPILVAGENVGIKAVDNGVACAANSLFVAVSGVHFDLT